jgi:hypothetical protein
MNKYFFFSLLLLNASILLSGLEYFKSRSVFLENGLLDWKMLRLRERIFTTQYVDGFFDVIYNKGLVLLFLLMVTFSISGIFIVTFYNKFEIAGLLNFQIVALTLIVLFYNYRSRYALDGSDQFNTIYLTSLSLCIFLDSKDFLFYFFTFISFQLSIAYFIAGLYKLFSFKWLSGEALADVFNGQVYGNKFIAKTFEKLPLLGVILSVIVIAWEVSFPLAFFFNETIFFTFLAVGLLFHLFNATFMGLNCFLLSFASGYPALIYCYYEIAS